MSNEVALDKVYDASLELLHDLAKAHRLWAERQNVTSGLCELAAMYVAFRVMLKVFPIDQAISDPESLQHLEHLIDEINPTRGPLPAKAPKATA